MICVVQHQEERDKIIREMPVMHGEEGFRVRADFRDLYRVVKFQTATERDLDFIRREVVARRERLGLARPS